MAQKIPFPFVIDELASLRPRLKPMFGCTALYVGDKIVLIQRHKDEATDDNGIWIATTGEHHASLQKDFPSMRSIGIFGPGPTGWQNLPLESPDFESAVLRLCAFIRAKDPRVGKVPKGRKVKKKKPAQKRKPRSS